MNIFVIIIGILVFSLLITVHELGHFIAAKLCNVRVSEFAIGMGPALFKRQKGETLYALRVFPIGGYCAMEEDEESNDPNSFVNKPWWQRLIILAAGAAMNFLTGFIILLFIVQGYRYLQPTITEFYEGCPYESAEYFQLDDSFYSIDGNRIYFSSNVSYYLEHGETHDIVIIRDGERISFENIEMVKHEYIDDGETKELYGLKMASYSIGFGARIRDAWYASIDYVRLVWGGLGDLISGRVGISEMSGPVGIVSFINDVGVNSPNVAVAAFQISDIAALIAVNLAVMNMLPIPALDGGRIFFLLINAGVEAVTKRRINPKYEGYVHATGMLLMLALMAFVMFNDIYRLFV